MRRISGISLNWTKYLGKKAKHDGWMEGGMDSMHDAGTTLCHTFPLAHVHVLVVEVQEGFSDVSPSRSYAARLADVRLLYRQVAL